MKTLKGSQLWIALLVVVGIPGLAVAQSQEATPKPARPVNRYVIYYHSENFNQAFMLDTVTGRVWQLVHSTYHSEGEEVSFRRFVRPSGTRSGHIQSCTLKKQHRKALRLSGVRPFVLYSLRHTFLTRLGESGCDAWTLARIAGHSSVAISARYVHPSEDAVMAAVERLGGHNSRHSPELAETGNDAAKQLTA